MQFGVVGGFADPQQERNVLFSRREVFLVEFLAFQAAEETELWFESRAENEALTSAETVF